MLESILHKLNIEFLLILINTTDMDYMVTIDTSFIFYIDLGACY